MDRAEFERRKSHLESELESGIELLRAGFRAQMKALEQLWLLDAAGAPAAPAREEAPGASSSSPRQAASPPLDRKRRPANELHQLVVTLLPQLPEVFDRTDILPRLGFQPRRSTFHSVLENLERSGAITKVESGRGAAPSRYRRL